MLNGSNRVFKLDPLLHLLENRDNFNAVNRLMDKIFDAERVRFPDHFLRLHLRDHYDFAGVRILDLTNRLNAVSSGH